MSHAGILNLDFPAFQNFEISICCLAFCACMHAQLHLTLCDPKYYSCPGSSVHGILQARKLDWISIPFSRGSSQLWDWTWVSCIAGRFFIIWATGSPSGDQNLNIWILGEHKHSDYCTYFYKKLLQFVISSSFHWSIVSGIFLVLWCPLPEDRIVIRWKI